MSLPMLLLLVPVPLPPPSSFPSKPPSEKGSSPALDAFRSSNPPSSLGRIQATTPPILFPIPCPTPTSVVVVVVEVAVVVVVGVLGVTGGKTASFNTAAAKSGSEVALMKPTVKERLTSARREDLAVDVRRTARESEITFIIMY